MKISLALCCLCLAAGVVLGHLNGKYTAAANFIDDCETRTVVVFHDQEADERRNFHCFEIADPQRHERATGEWMKPARMI